MKRLTCVWVVGGFEGSGCQSGHHGGYQPLAGRDLLHDRRGSEGGGGVGHGPVSPHCGAALGQRVGGHGVGAGGHRRYQAGGRVGQLEGQPGHQGEEGVGASQGAVGESQGHGHVAGQGLGQQAGHALARVGQRRRELQVVAGVGGGGDGGGGRGQQVGHGAGLLGSGRGAQAGVLAADGGEVHEVIIAGLLWLLLGYQVGRGHAHDPGGADVAALVLALVGGHLAGGGEGEAAARADAVEVIGGLTVHTTLIPALLVLVELLEAILGIGVILDVVALVLLNVTLVLEGECTAWASEGNRGGGNRQNIIR